MSAYGTGVLQNDDADEWLSVHFVEQPVDELADTLDAIDKSLSEDFVDLVDGHIFLALAELTAAAYGHPSAQLVDWQTKLVANSSNLIKTQDQLPLLLRKVVALAMSDAEKSDIVEAWERAEASQAAEFRANVANLQQRLEAI